MGEEEQEVGAMEEYAQESFGEQNILCFGYQICGESESQSVWF